MNNWIEINYNYSQLVNLLEEFKCELVKVIIKSGGLCNKGNCCCLQQGYLCKFNPNLLLLVKPEEKAKIYIPVDAVAAIRVVDKCNESKKSKEQINSEKQNDESNDAQEPKEDINESQEEENKVAEINETKESNSIYGYGRKIKINLLKEKNNFAVTEINMTELSLSISLNWEKNNSFIYYFHKDGVNDRAVELLLSPTGPGFIEAVTTNRAATKAIIKGRGLVYLDSEHKGECDFKLLVTKNRIVIKIENEDVVLERHDKDLVGICDQEDAPFIIKKE